MSLFRNIYNRLVRYDEDGTLYFEQGEGRSVQRPKKGSPSFFSLRPSPSPPKEELGIGALVTEDLARIFGVEKEEIQGVSQEHLWHYWVNQ